jgi:hypothetical protein
MLETGERGDYRWFVGEFEGSLVDVVVACHLGHRVAVSSFDGAVFHPTVDEVAEGWTTRGDLALSPVLRAGMDLPRDGDDEWYVFDEQSSPEWSLEVFVNLGAFTVVPVDEIERRRDPTWEAHAFDWLIPVQERFWEQISRIRPISYVAMGEKDLIVTRNHELAARLLDAR